MTGSKGLLLLTLEAAVPIWIRLLQEQGGPTAADYVWAREFAPRLAKEGDELLYRSRQPGKTAGLFNDLARALAIGSYAPGGVTFGGLHWESPLTPP